MTGNFDFNWLYWVVQILGDIIAADVYKALHKETNLTPE
jgi:glycerol uptake facilitator-like aquaporin